MKIIGIESSNDKKAIKVLQLTEDCFVTETGVFDDGNIVHLCISSQIGCPIGCQMCYNGINKSYTRNLSFDEIIDQITNIVGRFELTKKYQQICFSFMGVGEPMLNYDNVISAIRYLDEFYECSIFALATTLPRAEDIIRLTDDLNAIRHFKLTISLHASNDTKRKKLIPTHSSMENLRLAMDYYKENSRHKGEFNYLLLKDFNDLDDDFEELLNFLDPTDRIKISTYNSIENGVFDKSSQERYAFLHQMLDNLYIHNSQFNSVGDSIDVGCGQMAAKKLERVRTHV